MLPPFELCIDGRYWAFKPKFSEACNSCYYAHDEDNQNAMVEVHCYSANEYVSGHSQEKWEREIQYYWTNAVKWRQASAEGNGLLPKILDCAYDRALGTPYVVTEITEQWVIPEAVKDNAAQLEFWLDQLGKAVGLLHKHNILLGNFSPERIFKKDGIQLSFSTSIFLLRDDYTWKYAKYQRGYNKFAAPELYDPRLGGLGTWTDVYGLSAVLYYLITGWQPMGAMERMAGNLIPPKIPYLSDRQNAALRRGLALRPGERIQTVEELISLMRPEKNTVTVQENPQWCLRVGTLLNGRYRVGTIRKQWWYHIEYEAEDIVTHSPVLIEEFYCSDVTGRKEDGSLEVWTGAEKDFYYGIVWFGKQIGYAREISNLLRGWGYGYLGTFSQNNTQYAVLSWQEGQPLEIHVKEQGIGCDRFEMGMAYLRIRQAINILSVINDGGLVHTWLTPETILLGDKGSGISYFGHICRPPDRNADPIEDKGSEPRRRIWEMWAQPPELFSRKWELGPWSSVYSLCAILVALFTGKKPQPAIDRICGETDLEKDLTMFPNDLRQILEKGLAIRGKDRYQSVAELDYALSPRFAYTIPCDSSY